MRKPPAERVRFIFMLKMLRPLLAFAGEWLGLWPRGSLLKVWRWFMRCSQQAKSK